VKISTKKVSTKLLKIYYI